MADADGRYPQPRGPDRQKRPLWQTSPQGAVYVYQHVPAISSISAHTGSLGGGHSIHITGEPLKRC